MNRENMPVPISNESLSLACRIPSTARSWLKVRFSGTLFWNDYKTSLADLRGNNLILKFADDESSSSANGSQQRVTLSGSVQIVSLKDTAIRILTRRNMVNVRRIGFPDMELQFGNPGSTKKWFFAMLSACEKRGVDLSDFNVLSKLGEGAFGRVYLVENRRTGEQLAMKVVQKSEALKNELMVRRTLDERVILELTDGHPFLLSLRHSFQTSHCLFLVTEFCQGGDLDNYVKMRGKPLSEDQCRRIAGEVLLALEHLHSLGVVYRDLKLENVLLDANGHVRLADFGLAKLLNVMQNCGSSSEIAETSDELPRHLADVLRRTGTFCGTAEYMSPEMVKREKYGQSADMWAFGVFVYELISGTLPFSSYGEIKRAEVQFPKEFSPVAISLIRGLMEKKTSSRLGQGPNGIADVKKHDFFKDVDWNGMLARQLHRDNVGYVGNVFASLGNAIDDSNNDFILSQEEQETNPRGMGRAAQGGTSIYQLRNVAGYTYTRDLRR